jgi:hypothetical protein
LERGGRVETAQIHNLLLKLYLRLKAGDLKDLARLEDVLKLHGFLSSFDARWGQLSEAIPMKRIEAPQRPAGTRL